MNADDSKFDTENISGNVPLKSLVFKVNAECKFLHSKDKIDVYYLAINQQLMLNDNVNEATKCYQEYKKNLEIKAGNFEVFDEAETGDLMHETCIHIVKNKNIVECIQYSVLTMPTDKVCIIHVCVF